MILFFLMTLLVVLFSKIADKNNSRLALLIVIALLTCFSGLRSENVGIDTIGYFRDFNSLIHGGYVFLKDAAFLIISKALMTFFKSPYALFFIYSAIINIFIILRLWDFRRNCSFTLMVFMYVSMFFFESMNIMRQFVAIALLFYATRYILKKKYVLYFVFMVIASAFHLTGLLGIVIFMVYLLVESKDDTRVRNLLLLFAALATFALYYLYSNYFDRYSAYFNSKTVDFGLMTFYQIASLALICFIAKFSIKNGMYSIDTYHEYQGIDWIVTLLFTISLGFVSLGMLYRYMERIGLYFQMFQLPFWGQAVKISRYRLLIKTICAVFVGYYFILIFLSNGQGIFPYEFFWQK